MSYEVEPEAEGGGGEDAYAWGESVDAVDEVEGVDDADDDDEGEDVAAVVVELVDAGKAVEAVEADVAQVDDDACGDDLSHEFDGGAEADDVVFKSEEKHDDEASYNVLHVGYLGDVGEHHGGDNEAWEDGHSSKGGGNYFMAGSAIGHVVQVLGAGYLDEWWDWYVGNHEGQKKAFNGYG